METIKGFKTINEIQEALSLIGDVKTQAGRDEMYMFLTRLSLAFEKYSFKTTLPNNLTGRFEGEFSENVTEAVMRCFTEYIETIEIPPKSYYWTEENKLQPGLSDKDNFVGNALYNLNSTMYYAGSRMRNYLNRYGSYEIVPYNEDDVASLEESAKNFINQNSETINKIR